MSETFSDVKYLSHMIVCVTAETNCIKNAHSRANEFEQFYLLLHSYTVHSYSKKLTINKFQTKDSKIQLSIDVNQDIQNDEYKKEEPTGTKE